MVFQKYKPITIDLIKTARSRVQDLIKELEPIRREVEQKTPTDAEQKLQTAWRLHAIDTLAESVNADYIPELERLLAQKVWPPVPGSTVEQSVFNAFNGVTEEKWANWRQDYQEKLDSLSRFLERIRRDLNDNADENLKVKTNFALIDYPLLGWKLAPKYGALCGQKMAAFIEKHKGAILITLLLGTLSSLLANFIWSSWLAKLLHL